MFRLDLSKEKLELDYPCAWVYKVIGSSREELEAAVAEVMVDREYSVTLSNTSSGGKYVCLNVELEVMDEEDRTNIFEVLRKLPVTRYIL